MSETTATRRRRTQPNRGPTLHDVARTAGVSTASASRALSRPDLVSEELRERVMAARQTLAYVPNIAAQVLSGRPSRLVGAIVSSLNDPLTAISLEALTRELAANGVALILMVTGNHPAAPEECVRTLLARGAGAIVFGGDASPNDLPGVLAGRRLPCASFDHAWTEAVSSHSSFDRAKALALAARYLQQLGHAHIGFFAIGGDRRISDVRTGLAGTGIGVLDDLSADPLKPVLGASEALDHWLSLPTPPTGLVGGSDAAAVALVQECKRREIAVPEHMSVIGCGDTELSRLVCPALSTLRLPAREAGTALARNLLACMEGRTETSPEIFAKLVARESTAPRRG